MTDQKPPQNMTPVIQIRCNGCGRILDPDQPVYERKVWIKRVSDQILLDRLINNMERDIKIGYNTVSDSTAYYDEECLKRLTDLTSTAIGELRKNVPHEKGPKRKIKAGD